MHCKTSKQIIWIITAGLLSLPSNALAQPLLNIEGSGISTEASTENQVYTIIQGVLAIVGGFAVLSLIVGGFMYITSAGATERIEQAKLIITYSIVGLIIILLAFTIVATINAILS